MKGLKTLYQNLFERVECNIQSKYFEKIIALDEYIPYNSTFFCIVNTKDLTFKYISKWMHQCIGFDENTFKKNGLFFIWDRIHPNDFNQLLFAWNELTFYLLHEDIERKKIISYSWNYRFKNSNDKYINIVQNTTSTASNSLNNSNCILSYYTIVNPKIKMRVYVTVNIKNDKNIFESKSFGNIPQKSILTKISERERDVIHLLTLHLSSKEISDKLFISVNTVNTHRRNIIKKLHLSSTGEIVGRLEKN